MTIKKIDTASPEAQSADLVAGNIEQLKALFPELITEGAEGVAVNVDVLKALVGDATVTDADEKYGFNWHGKRRARQLALTPSTGTLRPCPEDSVDWDTTQNLMIEGDNLEVLKLLQKSYAGKVKLIYIDPPYNTGKDFVYPDNFQDNIKNYLELTSQIEGGQKISSNTDASGRFHTDWLNMIYPRLKLAHSLLLGSGAIFLSIDDHEVDNLRKACNEIFGEENFVASVCWERADSPRMDADYFSTKHDYVLCYAKNIEDFKLKRTPYEGEDIPEHFNKVDQDERRYYLKPLRAMGGQGETRAARPNLYFALTAPDGESVYPKLEGGGDGAWRWSPKKVEMEKARIDWTGSKGSWTPYYRIYADESEGKPPETIWFSTEVGSTRNATAEVKALFDGVKCFDTPKPIALLERIISLTTAADDNVLDFFGGSGTTGHAVISQNVRDGGARRYILVQLPEPLEGDSREQKIAADLCEKLRLPKTVSELTKERLRRAGAKVKSDNPGWQGDTGFRVFKLDTSNIRAWNPKPDDLEATLFDHQDHLFEGRSEADVLYELLLKLGLDLCVPIEKRSIEALDVHSVGGGVLMACLGEKIAREQVEPLAQGIIVWHKELAPAGETTCVFRDSAFADDVAKTNLAAILEQHGIQNVRSL
ncbi:site-specific DNA-methyltransferase [Achromobacter sp. E1]|uniref:site-specific DNA-methyltransferase n=1 Tax=Achromobacter sp. E1 TaxID=3141581 RepID=UPI0030D39B7C